MTHPLIFTRFYENCTGRIRRREFTAEDVHSAGYRDGFDGIKFYPCTEWDREGLDDPTVYGDTGKAEDVYADGYKAGRADWRRRTGGFPSSGDDRFDAEILAEMETANA